MTHAFDTGDAYDNWEPADPAKLLPKAVILDPHWTPMPVDVIELEI